MGQVGGESKKISKILRGQEFEDTWLETGMKNETCGEVCCKGMVDGHVPLLCCVLSRDHLQHCLGSHNGIAQST